MSTPKFCSYKNVNTNFCSKTFTLTDFLKHHLTFNLSTDSLITDILGKWQDRLQYMDTDYQHKETVLALRCSSLHAALKQVTHHLSRSPSPSLPSTTQLSSNSTVLYDGLNHALLSQAELAREAERYQVIKISGNMNSKFDLIFSFC